MKRDEKHLLYFPTILDEFVENTAEHFTKSIEDAMFIFPDGRMTSSTEEGIRGDDHTVIEEYFSCLNRDDLGSLYYYEPKVFYNLLCSGIGAITVVPESKKLLKGSNQIITSQQKKIITQSEFLLEDFIVSEPLTAEYEKKHQISLSIGDLNEL